MEGDNLKQNRVISLQESIKKETPKKIKVPVSRRKIQDANEIEFIKLAIAIDAQKFENIIKVMGIDFDVQNDSLESVYLDEKFDFDKFLRVFDLSTSDMIEAFNSGYLDTY